MNEKTTYLNCPCKKKSCPRHGDCEACRRHHADSKYKRPVYCEKKSPFGNSGREMKALFQMLSAPLFT